MSRVSELLAEFEQLQAELAEVTDGYVGETLPYEKQKTMSPDEIETWLTNKNKLNFIGSLLRK